jgi:hypothetical protein
MYKILAKSSSGEKLYEELSAKAAGIKGTHLLGDGCDVIIVGPNRGYYPHQFHLLLAESGT